MIARALANATSRGHVIGAGDEMAILTGGLATASGERVSAETAQKVAVVYACVYITTQAVRAMPLRIVRDSGDGILRQERESRLWELLHDRPNPEQHAGELWEWVTRAMQLRGNAFCWIDRFPDGRVRYLRPLNPGRVEVGRHPTTGKKMFVVHAPDDREQVQFVGGTDDILHFKGVGDDPLLGVSIIHFMRETIGRALSEDRHAATMMKNGGRPSGILKVKGRLDPDRAKALAERWESAHGGSRAGRTAVLEDDADWKQVVMSASDLEMVKQRAISREDVAIAWAMPGDMVLAGSQANLHYSSDASRDVRLVKYAAMPWATRIQDALEICDLLPWTFGGAGRLLPRFNPDGLLKADIKTRYEAYKSGIDAGWLDPNTPRRIEDLEPVEGLDKPKPMLAQQPSATR